MFRSKSSKATKCKTASRMIVSRIKLLRNKRETQLKHLRADIARLLESKQEENARSRVDHAIREQNMIEAYGIIENCCELLISRLASITSQKTCPQDLLEPIANLIYAAPRCGDLPELQDIRSIFGDKYGKQFVTRIVELREGCGVSQKMIEKLSTHQVSIEKKVDYMSQVAAEYNVKWTPTRDLGADEVKQAKPAMPPASVGSRKVSDVGSPKSPLQVQPIPAKEPVESSEDEPVTEAPKPKRGAVAQGDKQSIPFAVTKQPSPRASKAAEDPKLDPYSQYAGNRLNPYEAAALAPARSGANPYESGAMDRLNPYEVVVPAAVKSRLNPYEATSPAPSNGQLNPYEPSKNRPSSYEANAPASAKSNQQLNSVEPSPAGNPRQASGSRTGEYKRTLLSGSYSDVANAAEAAAQSAEHAAAAARVAAELANKEHRRASSGSSHANKIEVPHLKEKLESYVKSHATNDAEDPSDWESPSVRTPVWQELNPNRRWGKETLTPWNSTGIIESKTDFWRASLDETRSDAQVEFLKTSVAAGNDADELFRAAPAAKLQHSIAEKHDDYGQAPVFDGYKQPVFDQPDVQPVVDSHWQHEEPLFDEHPAFDDRPAFDEHQALDKQATFDERPVFDKQISRLDSVTLGLQTMSSKFAELYGSSDEEEKPSTRNQQSGGGRQGKQDVGWKQLKEELAWKERSEARYQDDEDWNGEGGRGSGWRMSSREAKVPSNSSRSQEQQFHGAGVDHTEAAATMRKHRLPAASVRTRRGL